MTQARYIIRIADGELFPFLKDWLKIPGMVEYDPAIHGYRKEVAAQMGLPDPAPLPTPVVAAPKADTKHGAKAKSPAVPIQPPAETAASDKIQDLFGAK